MLYNSRADWGAVPSKSRLPVWGVAPSGIAVHYVGGSGHIGLAEKDHGACLTLVRNLQAYAMSGSYRWTYADLEYNLVACPHGYVIEGRGLGFQGAAQLDANSTHVSVLMLANVDDGVNLGIAAATNDAISLVSGRFPITSVVGHRDTAGNPTGTNCPGDMIEAWLHAGRPGTPAPAPAPPTEVLEVTATVIVDGVANTFDARPSDGHVIQVVTGRKPFDVCVNTKPYPVAPADKFVDDLNAFVEAGEVVVRGRLADGSVGELRYAAGEWRCVAYR